jgi:hypothetical protein
MRFLPLFLSVLFVSSIKSASAQAPDLFHERIDTIATKFISLNIPDLEKIQLPQQQSDGSYIFIYIWLPKTHRPNTASFEANIADYFDVVGAQQKVYAGWCYLRKPEAYVLKTGGEEVGVMRIWALGFYGRTPRSKCGGGAPGAAGNLGQTHVIKDPASGLISMVRSGHPTRFPLVADAVQ